MRSFLNLFIYSLVCLTLNGCRKDITEAQEQRSVQSYDFIVTDAFSTQDDGFILSCVDRLVKLDEDGGVEFEVSFGNTFSDERQLSDINVFQAKDGSFVLSASSFEFVSSSNSFRGILNVARFDPFGNLLWSNEFSVSKLIQDPRFDPLNFKMTNGVDDSFGNYVFSGSLLETDGLFKYVILRISEEGILTLRNFYPFEQGQITNILATSGGGFIVSGTVSNVFVSVLSQLFVEMSVASLDNANVGEGQIISNAIELSDGTFLLSGSANIGTGGFTDINFFFINIDGSGILLDSKSFGTNKQDFSLFSAQTRNGDFTFSGSRRKLVVFSGETALLFTKVNANNEVVWERIFGDGLGMQANFHRENKDGTFTIIGFKFGYKSAAVRQTFFLRTKPDGTLD